MISNMTVLRPGYVAHSTVDLKSDRRVAAAIQVVFALIALGLIALALVLEFPLSGGLSVWVKWVVTLAACVLYVVVHELTHAGLLWSFTGMRPAIALRLPYLIVGSLGYLNKRSFILVALSPALIWGTTLVALLFLLPSEFFLSIYVVTILNFAGSAGDYFQALAVARLPKTALIQDDGRITTVYSIAE